MPAGTSSDGAKRGSLATGLGLVASVAALAAGGVALGIELEHRIVSKRIARNSEADLEEFFALRSDGPDVITPDGVVLHTEVDEGELMTSLWSSSMATR